MRSVQVLLLAGLLALVASTLFAEEPPKMKMTTPIPDGIATPDKLETSIGTLTSRDGVPDAETTRKVFDNLDSQRAVQAYLSSIQIASMHGMRKGILEFGPANTTMVAWENLMDSKALFLTPNTSNMYFFMWVDLKDGPIAFDAPPNVIGLVDDFWFHYVCDFGRVGPDKGKGGKYLLLPPGYDGEVPDGYHTFRSQTYGNWLLFRAFQVDGDPAPGVAAAEAAFRVYPLSQAANPPKMNFVNVSGKNFNTIHSMDYRFFEEVNQVVQEEPGAGQDPEILGLLASIGIRKGQPFAPDARMKKILADAANIGAVTVRALAAQPREDAFYYYPGEGVWVTPFVGGSYEFINAQNARNLDGRAFFHFYATGITPAMSKAPVGAGSQYAVAYKDAGGNALDGSKTYRVHLPPNVPAKEFWSFVVYDNQTRSMLQTDQQFPSVSSVRKTTKANEDGSFDVYFGPKAPPGKEGNWIQTIPGKGWNMLFRLYSPLKPWFDKTWRPGDPVLVK